MAKKTYTSSEEARTAILDAAEKITVAVGPAGLRLSAVAKEAGMAHPNILHHFGSREGLLTALAERVSNNATQRITAAINDALSAKPDTLIAATTQVLDSAYEGDQGKLAVWLAMSGAQHPMQENMQQIVNLSHKLRQKVDRDADIKNTERLVLMVTLALIGEVVSGEVIKEALGFDNDGHPAHFRQWLAEIILHLHDKELETSLSGH